MTRIEDLKQRVQRLPELTKQANWVATLQQTQESLGSIYTRLTAIHAAAMGLSRVAAAIGPDDLRQQAKVCCDKVNSPAALASKLTTSVRRSKLLPPTIEKQLQAISGAEKSAGASVKQMWNDMAQAIARDQAPLLAVASRLGIAGAQESAAELTTLAGGEPPRSAEQADNVVSCHQRAKHVIESLPQEGPVGSFLEKLVQGDGVALSVLAEPEVHAFVKQHDLEQRLVVRLVTG